MVQELNTEYRDISGPVAEILLERFKRISGSIQKSDQLLQDSLEKLESDIETKMLDGVSDLVSIIWTLCMDQESSSSTRLFGNRSERLRNLLSLNPRIFRLRTHTEDHQYMASFGWHLNLPGGKSVRISFGNVTGLSGIIPLTRQGIDEYMMNRVSAKEFGSHINLVDQNEHANFLYISGVAHVCTIPELVAIQNGLRMANKEDGGTTLRMHIEHIKDFLPKLFESESRIMTRSFNETSAMVVSPISGNGMGQFFLEKAGFSVWQRIPRDYSGHQKFIFDFGMLNDRRTFSDESIDTMLHCLRWTSMIENGDDSKGRLVEIYQPDSK